MMDSHQLAVLLGPLGAFIVFGVFALWVKRLIARHSPPWLRDVMLKERWRSAYSDEHRKALEDAAPRAAATTTGAEPPVEIILKDAMDRARGRGGAQRSQ